MNHIVHFGLLKTLSLTIGPELRRLFTRQDDQNLIAGLAHS